jgi:DNA modification methylase
MLNCVYHFNRLAKPEAHLYICCDIDQFHWLKDTFGKTWNVFRTPLINYKTGSGRVPLPEHGPRRCSEYILYAHRGGKRVTGIYPDVITTAGDENLGHGAQKPVALISDLLKRSVKPGDRVLDPFVGTGTIFDAAHAHKVRATGIEREANYFGIAARRLEALDGPSQR